MWSARPPTPGSATGRFSGGPCPRSLAIYTHSNCTPAHAQPNSAPCSRCREASLLAAIRIRYQVPGAAGGDQVGAEQLSGQGSIPDQP